MSDILPMTEYKTKRQRDHEYLQDWNKPRQPKPLPPEQGPDGHTELGAEWADRLHAKEDIQVYRKRSDKR